VWFVYFQLAGLAGLLLGFLGKTRKLYWVGIQIVKCGLRVFRVFFVGKIVLVAVPKLPCGIELSSFKKEEYPKGEVVGIINF